MKNIISVLFFLLLPFQILFAQKNNQENLLSQVDSLINSFYQPDRPGIALAIVKEGKTIYSQQMGLSNMEYEIPISDTTAFHIASVSKQFTAYLAVSLEKESKLNLNDDITKYLPELKNLPFKITVRQLANHTHGLPNLFELAQLKGIGISDRMTHKEVVQMLLNIKNVNFRPGEKYEYNNTGFVLLAEIIERIIGKPFQEILKNRIFIPLEMVHTEAVAAQSLIVKNKGHSYKLNNGSYENYPFNLMANGSSGISTTITDLSKWVINFQMPNVQTQSTFQEMEQKTTLNAGQTVEYGLGLEFKNYKGLDLVFHGGGDAAYRSYILNVPKYQFSVIVLGNANDFAPLKIVYNIVDLFLNEHQKKPLPPVKPLYTTQELKSFEGTYQMFPGTYYNIIAQNDTLFFQSYGTKDKAPLPVIGDSKFLFPYIPTANFSFYKNRFNFHIADFNYACEKIHLNPPKSAEINLSAFTGIYKNNEFNTTYELIIANNQLVAIHSLNKNIYLHPLLKDSFYSEESYFGKLDFVRNAVGKVIEFRLSGQNLRNIEFKKIN